MKDTIDKYNLTYEKLVESEWKDIKSMIIKKTKQKQNEIETRNSNEYKLTELFIKTHRTYNKRKKCLVDNEFSRENEWLFNKIKFGVIQTNKFRNRKDKKVRKKCPNKNCNEDETRTHLLFYCPAYENLRKNFFSNKRIKNSLYQEKIIKNKKMKMNILNFVKEAFKQRKANKV